MKIIKLIKFLKDGTLLIQASNELKKIVPVYFKVVFPILCGCIALLLLVA